MVCTRCGDSIICPNPNGLFGNTFTPTTSPRVTWVDGTYTNLMVDWDPIPNAVGYNVYGSPSPTTINKLTPTPITATSFPYIAPNVPTDVVWHFWVTWIGPTNVETYVSNDPVTLYTKTDAFDPCDPKQTTTYGQEFIFEPSMQFYFNEIRRRHQVMLENDGENFDVYFRRWSGPACPHEDNRVANDPDYNSLTRDDICFGTGIVGGFYPHINLRMRYGNLPNRLIKFSQQGVVFGHDFNSWTLWTPRLHEHDMCVRRLTGERFIVVEAAESSWRGMVTYQKFRLVALQPTDIRHHVTDVSITTALSTGPTLPFEQPTIWG